MSRNIKNGLFGWYEKGAMEKIETIDFKQQASCKLIYIALCSMSAKQMNKPEIECYKFDLARFASVSEKTIQRYLPELERLNIITVGPQDRKSNGKFEKVKIWLNKTNSTAGQFGDRGETDERQMRDTKSDIYKEINKEINNSAQNDFDNFYKLYPRKVGKAQAQKTFKKIIKKHSSDFILNALGQQLRKWKQDDQDKQFMPYPSTWLNERLLDFEEIKVPTKPKEPEELILGFNPDDYR